MYIGYLETCEKHKIRCDHEKGDIETRIEAIRKQLLAAGIPHQEIVASTTWAYDEVLEVG